MQKADNLPATERKQSIYLRIASGFIDKRRRNTAKENKTKPTIGRIWILAESKEVVTMQERNGETGRHSWVMNEQIALLRHVDSTSSQASNETSEGPFPQSRKHLLAQWDHLTEPGRNIAHRVMHAFLR